MKKSISNLIKTSALATVISMAGIFAYANNSHQMANSFETTYVANSAKEERVDEPEYINNALTETSRGATFENAYGYYPLLLKNGNIVFSSSSSDQNAYQVIDQEGNDVATGHMNFKPQDAFVMDNGDIFVTTTTNGWHQFSGVDGTEISSGKPVPNRTIYAADQAADGTIVLVGNGGYWDTLKKDSTGKLVHNAGWEDTDYNSKYKLSSYNLQKITATDDGQLIITNDRGAIFTAVLEEGTSYVLPTNKGGYINIGNGGEWQDNSKAVVLETLTTGEVIALSNHGELAFMDPSSEEAKYPIRFTKLYEDSTIPSNLNSFVEFGGHIIFIDPSNHYFVSSMDGTEIVYKGDFPSDDENSSNGAVVLESGELLVGGSKRWTTYSEGYSYANDVVDTTETKANILQYVDSEGNHLQTGVSTYADIETALRETVASEFNMPTDVEYSDIIQFDRSVEPITGEATYTEVTDTTNIWTSDEINFKVVSAETDQSIIGETDIITIDLQFPVAIRGLEVTDVSQSKVQIDYEFIIPDTNPVVGISILDTNDNVIGTSEAIMDETNPSLAKGRFIIDDLQSNYLYEDLYLQVKYRQSATDLIPDVTTKELEGSILSPFKTLKDELAIKGDAVKIIDPEEGVWYTVFPDGTLKAYLDMEVYADSTEEFVPGNVTASISRVDKYNVSTQIDLGVEASEFFDDPNTIVHETRLTLTTNYVPDVTYAGLQISLTGFESDAISVPILDQDGNVIIYSRTPEEIMNPNHLVFMIIIISLVAIIVIIAIVASIVIYKKHHFHH